MIEAYSRHGSWTSCKQCGLMRPRSFEAMDLHREPAAEVTACNICKKIKKITKATAEEERRIQSADKIKGNPSTPVKPNVHYVPQPGDVPVPLRDLTPDIVEALRPLEKDVGLYRRNLDGYREHTSMIRFAWSSKSVEEKIEELHGSDRKKAVQAYEYLMSAETSAYSEFVEKHEKFLAECPGANERKRKRPWQFLETRNLENAVWPHLYWKYSMCETNVRSTDERRLARTGRKETRNEYHAEAKAASSTHVKKDAAPTSSEGEEESEEPDDKDFEEDEGEWEVSDEDKAERDRIDIGPEFIEAGRHSAKSSFMAKVHSPVIGYGTDYDLLHFVYDLNMWSDLGSKKNAVEGTPLRATWPVFDFFVGFIFEPRSPRNLGSLHLCPSPNL